MEKYLPQILEFRKRLFKSCILIFILFSILFWQAQALYAMVTGFFANTSPLTVTLIATEVTTPFTVPMKLAFIVAIFLAMPYILYQLWGFISPALYQHEKTKMLPVIISSILLFYMGTMFAYFLICPVALSFFSSQAPRNVQVMTDMKYYLEFILSVVFGGGIAFQTPVLTLAVIQAKLLSREKLQHLRPYMIVLAFILGMLLTPPDVVSQILLALPIWGLFEIGLLWALILEKKSFSKKLPSNTIGSSN